MYAKYFKRLFDIVFSLTALIVLLPLLLVLYIAGAAAMRGNPIFVQQRPGKTDSKTGQEKIFKLVKFRTMSNAKDEYGNLLPDEIRLNTYGKFLRNSSLDELLELWNVLKGDMSIVGPRPQLVRDMIFMSEEQRRRHTVRPGLTGLAQVNGRNNIPWEQKFDLDLKYIDGGITFCGDIIIILKTFIRVFKQSDTVREGTNSDIDFGDYLLQNGSISEETYIKGRQEEKELLEIK